MREIIPANKRHFTDHGWLKTYWLFSFSNYYDPDNIDFGSLRVFNDDVVDPGGGFPTHPHKEMEIISIVLDGQLTHADSMGSKGTIGQCEVQRMSAGTGLTHSEYNDGDTPTHFYQIWLYPDEKGLEPAYEQKCFTEAGRRNVLQAVASGRGDEGALTIHVDATIYLSDLDAGKSVVVPGEGERLTFMYVRSGRVTVGEDQLGAGDQLRVAHNDEIRVIADEDASFTLIAQRR